MSMTKRHLESLPEAEQNKILGVPCAGDDCDICYDQADEANLNIRAFVSGNMDEDELTRRLVEDGILEL